MAITTIGGTINSTAVTPNLDFKYGPYSSLQEAYDALGPSGIDKIVVGLTVGIIESGEITEYWFKNGTELNNLVEKGETGITSYLKAGSGNEPIKQVLDQNDNEILPITSTEAVYNPLGDTTLESRLQTLEEDVEEAGQIPINTEQPQNGMLPGIVYNLGELDTNTTFTLASIVDNTIVNHYYWTFDIGNTVPTITWPIGLIWAGANIEPIISADTHYEISVLNNIGTYIDSPIIPLL